MNKHVKCVLIFFGVILGMISLSVILAGILMAIDWVAAFFGIDPLWLGIVAPMLAMTGWVTHLICND